MYKYEINVVECISEIPFECEKALSLVLRFIKGKDNAVICKVAAKKNETEDVFDMVNYSMENTSSLTFISFVKSVIPMVLENLNHEKESILKFIEIFEIQGDTVRLETKVVDNDVVGSEYLYDNIYKDLNGMCQELNIDSQILSSQDKEVKEVEVRVENEGQEEKMLDSEKDFDPNFEVLKTKLCEVSQIDISEKPESVVVEDEEEDNKYVSEFTKQMRTLEESIKDEFQSGKEYFLLCNMSEYMWKYLKSVNSKFPNPEFMGVCDYYLNTHGVFNSSARAFMIKYCINKSKYKN